MRAYCTSTGWNHSPVVGFWTLMGQTEPVNRGLGFQATVGEAVHSEKHAGTAAGTYDFGLGRSVVRSKGWGIGAGPAAQDVET